MLRNRTIVRRTAVAVLGTLTVLLSLASVITWWADRMLSDTDYYVATVGPLIRQPAVQDALGAQISDQIADQLKPDEVARGAAEALSDRRDLSPAGQQALAAVGSALAGAIEGRVDTAVDAVVTSPEFGTAWQQANRQAHTTMVEALEGESGGSVSTADGQLSVSIGAFVEAVKERLIARGFTLAERIPETDATFVLAQSADLEKAQRAYHVIDVARWVLPVLAIAAAVGAVAAARRRHRAAAVIGLAVVGGVAVAAIAIRWEVRHYAGAGGVLPYDASVEVYRALLGGLANAMTWLAAIGLLTAAVAVLTALASRDEQEAQS